MKKKLNIAAAVIGEKGRFLLCQRYEDDAYGGLWEFPGGCIEAGESAKKAIEREIKEELGINIKAQKLISEFVDEDDTLKIYISLFLCTITKGEPKAFECQDFGFFTIEEAKTLSLAPADKKILAFLR